MKAKGHQSDFSSSKQTFIMAILLASVAENLYFVQ